MESRNKNEATGLKNIFKLKDKLEWVINERALSYGKNIHPKHKLTRYHYFFIDSHIFLIYKLLTKLLILIKAA